MPGSRKASGPSLTEMGEFGSLQPAGWSYSPVKGCHSIRFISRPAGCSNKGANPCFGSEPTTASVTVSLNRCADIGAETGATDSPGTEEKPSREELRRPLPTRLTLGGDATHRAEP